MKQAAERLDTLPRKERDTFSIQVMPNELETIKVHPEVELVELIEAMKSLLQREEHLTHHQIAKEIMSVRERMSQILLQLQQNKVLEFNQLFTLAEGRMGLVVSLLAILELARQSLLIITQTQAFSPIHLQAA